MVAYHRGDGLLTELAGSSKRAVDVSYDDSVTHINANNVQDAIENLYNYFAATFPGWVSPRGNTNQ